MPWTPVPNTEIANDSSAMFGKASAYSTALAARDAAQLDLTAKETALAAAKVELNAAVTTLATATETFRVVP
jgi:hypothetical protein